MRMINNYTMITINDMRPNRIEYSREYSYQELCKKVQTPSLKRQQLIRTNWSAYKPQRIYYIYYYKLKYV